MRHYIRYSVKHGCVQQLRAATEAYREVFKAYRSLPLVVGSVSFSASVRTLISHNERKREIKSGRAAALYVWHEYNEEKRTSLIHR